MSDSLSQDLNQTLVNAVKYYFNSNYKQPKLSIICVNGTKIDIDSKNSDCICNEGWGSSDNQVFKKIKLFKNNLVFYRRIPHFY